MAAPSAYPEARALIYSEAIAQARAWMCGQLSIWCDTTDAQIAEMICTGQTVINGQLQTGGCDLYVGNNPVRLAICNTSTCPTSVPPPPPPTYGEAIAAARNWLCSQSPIWCTATDVQIAEFICAGEVTIGGQLQTGGCSLWVGSDPIRLAICGTSQCPVVPPPPPPGLSATLTASPVSVKPGDGVNFTASAQGGSTPYSYVFAFGDGTTFPSTMPTVTYQYPTEGVYLARVTVIDNVGVRATSSAVTITVSQSAPPPGGGNMLIPILLVGGLAIVGVLAFTIAQSGRANENIL